MDEIEVWCHNNMDPHRHFTLEGAVACWGTQSLYVMGTGYAREGISAAPGERAGVLSSPEQRRFVAFLGGCDLKAARMTKKRCSQYIDDLKSGTEPTLPPPATPLTDERWVPFPERVEYLLNLPPSEEEEEIEEEPVKVFKGVAKRETIVPIELLEMVKDGYYAVREDDDAPITFLRVSRPKHGHYRGAIKVQQQFGSGFGLRLEDKFIAWVGGGGKVEVLSVSIEQPILLLIVNPYEAAGLYAKERKLCARCNAQLTDARSMKYGIGPECEKHWPWMITQKDEEDALAAAEADELNF